MLELIDVDAGYGDVQVLHAISLTVEAGQVVSIVGANGAGKTTLINTISGLVRRRAGRILYEGDDISRLSPDEIVLRGIVQVPEGRKLFPEMTVHEHLLVGSTSRRARPERERALQEAVALFPVLRERANQLARTLSGGEQQMLAIARALMTRPRLLMLDEPSLGLAPLLVREVFRVVQELRRGGLTVLLV